MKAEFASVETIPLPEGTEVLILGPWLRPFSDAGRLLDKARAMGGAR